MKNGVNSKFVEGLIWNYGSVVILSISGFLINFLIICFYDAAALGVFSRAQAWYGVLSQITVWGVHMSVMRLIPEYQDARREQEMILSSAMAGVLMFSVVCVGMIELLLPRIITEHGRLLTSMQILMPGLVFFSLNKILLNYLNGLSMMKSYAFFQSLRYLVIVVIVWVMGALQCDYKWLTASFTGAELVVLAACVGYLIHRGLFIRHPGLKYLKRHASFGTRILLSNLVNELNTKVDIICLGFFVGDDYLIGIYSFAVLFAEGFYQLYFVVRRSINPKITEYYVRDTLKEGIGMLNSGLKRALRVASPLAFAALLTGYYVICCLLQRKEYLSGLTFLIVICLAIVVSGRKIILGNIFAQTSFPAIESLFNLITVISNFILNVIFILWLGLMGAAVATALSYLIYGHLLKYYVKKKFGIAI
ncbi:MAG: oligosaccharide flippase family protein [Lachnospiraceae bacterium]|jgi:O-antigen/teichoic acid export membrane protein|nr:oligosaccharide flippase family protein [Lachnospiraceae bacterium]RKI84231.1 hypothetical protein D7V90_07165 [bacterium 1xD42-87]